MIHKVSGYAMFPSKNFNSVKFGYISLCKLKQIKAALPSLMIINHIIKLNRLKMRTDISSSLAGLENPRRFSLRPI
jgi:hypothetical protein